MRQKINKQGLQHPEKRSSSNQIVKRTMTTIKKKRIKYYPRNNILCVFSL